MPGLVSGHFAFRLARSFRGVGMRRRHTQANFSHSNSSGGESRSTRHSGAHASGRAAEVRTRIPMCLALRRLPCRDSGFASGKCRPRPGMTSVDELGLNVPGHIFLFPVDSIPFLIIFPPRPAPPRGAIAIVTFAGWDAVDAGDAASRGPWVTSVFGQDGCAPALPLARRRPTLGWKEPWTV